MNLLKLIVIEKEWSWMEKKFRLIYWIQQDRKIMLQFVITIFEAEKVFSVYFQLQSLNLLLLQLTSGNCMF